jgi:hypothetical protein
MSEKTEAEIRDEDANKLRTIFRAKPDSPLPPRLVFWYWEYFNAYSRLGRTSMSDDLLVVVAMQFAAEAAAGKVHEAESPRIKTIIPPDPRHFGHLVEEGKVKAEQKVIATLGGKEREGVFKRAVSLNGKINEIVVQVGTEERQFKPEDVRVA